VANAEAAHPCHEVSWEAEAAIDGHEALRRLYRGFRDLDEARALMATEPGDSCRLIDRRPLLRLNVQTSRCPSSRSSSRWSGHLVVSVQQDGLHPGRRGLRQRPGAKHARADDHRLLRATRPRPD
jgi:hypothetical protein